MATSRQIITTTSGGGSGSPTNEATSSGQSGNDTALVDVPKILRKIGQAVRNADDPEAALDDFLTDEGEIPATPDELQEALDNFEEEAETLQETTNSGADFEFQFPTIPGDVTLPPRFEFENQTLQPTLSERELTNLRPEIVSILEYVNCYDEPGSKEDLTKIGNHLNHNKNLRRLRHENGKFIMGVMKDLTLSNRFYSFLTRKLDAVNREVKQEIELLENIVIKNENLRKALSIKDGWSQINNQFTSLRGSTRAKEPQGRAQSIDELFQTLNFSTANYRGSFSNTKLMYQALADLKNAIQRISYPSIVDDDIERENDADPFALNLSFPDTLSVNFSTNILSSHSGLIGDLADDIDFIINLLPKDNEVKVKFLTSLLTKEMRLSSGILRLALADDNATTTYAFGRPGIIDRIIGNLPKESILATPTNTNMTGYSKFSIQNQTILTHERQVITDFDTTIVNELMLPGDVGIVDPILESRNRPDVDNLKRFRGLGKTTIEKPVSTLEILLNYDGSDQTLLSASAYNKLLDKVRPAIQTLTNESSTYEQDLIILLLFELAQKNKQLNKALFTLCAKVLRNSRILGPITSNIVSITDAEIETIAQLAADMITGFSKEADSIASEGSGLIVGPTDSGLGTPLAKFKATLNSIKTKTNQSKMIDMLVEYFNDLEKDAKNIALKDVSEGEHLNYYYTSDENIALENKSRHNFVHRNMLFFLAYELFTANFNLANLVDYSYNKTTGVFRVIGDTNNAFQMSGDINNLLNNDTIDIGSFDNLEDIIGFRSKFNSIYHSLKKDDDTIRDLLDFVLAVHNNIKRNVNENISFFRAVKNNDNFRELNRSNSEIFRKLNKQQIILMKKAFDDLLKPIDTSLNAKHDIISESSFYALTELLKSPEFVGKKSLNTRVIAVGIPAGTISSLQEPTVDYDDKISKVNTSNKIKIRITKRNRARPSIQNADQTKDFIFRTDLFASIDDKILEEQPGNYRDVLRRYPIMTKYSLSGDPRSLSSVSRDIKKNHVQNHLMHLYYWLLTGMRFDENVFLTSDQTNVPEDPEVRQTLQSIIDELYNQEPDAEITNCFQHIMNDVTLLEQYILGNGFRNTTSANTEDVNRKGKGKNILDMINDGSGGAQDGISTSMTGDLIQSIRNSALNINCDLGAGRDQLTQEDYENRQNALNFINATVFSVSRRTSQIFTPKQFDRIFLIPVDFDNFDNSPTRDDDNLAPDTREEVFEMSDIYVTVELV